MSNWRPIIATDLTAAASSGKVTIILAAAAGRALPDPSAAAIANVTLELRAAIGFSGKYILDQDVTSLPTGVLSFAIKKIVRDMARSVNLPLTKDEEQDEKTYEARLEKIRQGQWPIDQPDNPVAVAQVQDSVLAPAIHCRKRRLKYHHQDGI